MADLLDIAPSTACEAVWIDGNRIIVRGVSGPALASLVAKFPELRSLVNGIGDNIVPRLIEFCGAAIGPIIAAGCGHLGEEACEQHAAQLLPEHQLKFLKAIFWLTFPNGIGSFLAALTSLVGGTGEGAKIKMRLRKSPSPSHSSFDADSRPTLQ
jgi:hypothetical protein